MTKEEVQIKKNKDEQNKSFFIQMKSSARSSALVQAPIRKIDKSNGEAVPLTATKRIKEAEIIYQWLIKDIK